MPISKPSILDSFFYQPNKDWNVCPDFTSEEIPIKTADGATVVCLYVHSSGKQKKGLVFLLHGRGGNASRYSYYAKPLIREGFDVFIVDWRGYGKSGGRPNHNNVLKDSRLALQYFLARSEQQTCKKILWGLSLGGQLAIHLAKEFPYCFHALVTEGSISSFEQAAMDYYHHLLKIPARIFTNKPYSAAKDIKKIENLPKLIIHSADDKEISFRNAEILFENALEPKSLLKIKGHHLYGLNRQNAPLYIREFKRLLQMA